MCVLERERERERRERERRCIRPNATLHHSINVPKYREEKYKRKKHCLESYESKNERHSSRNYQEQTYTQTQSD